MLCLSTKMEKLKIEEIIKACEGKLIDGKKQDIINNIEIDSRKIKDGDCFIAIKGQRLDGHDYCVDAIKNGAKALIVSKLFSTSQTLANIILVQDTTKALGDIAAYYRRKFSPQVIAITGSNGKSTTKEMISHLLQNRYNIVKVPNSYNNNIGVPLTVLKIDKKTEVLILEMEMNEYGGIKRLCDISLPDIGVLTNIGDSHLLYLTNRQGVQKEKAELLESIASRGIAVLNKDDPLVMEIGEIFQFRKKITYGINNTADIYATDIKDFGENGCEFLLSNKYKIRLNFPGRYNIYNALAAISVAQIFNISWEKIIDDLKSFKLLDMRMQKIDINGIEIFNDAYNANPQSMIAALQTFANFSAKGKKIVVLGDMLELGEKSVELHKKVGETFPNGIDIIITFGQYAHYIAEQAKLNNKVKDTFLLDSISDIVNKLVDITCKSDKILIKGSRALKMEEIIYNLQKYYACKIKTN